MNQNQQLSAACSAFASNFEYMLKELTALLSEKNISFHSGIYFQFIFMYAGFHLVSIFEADQRILLHMIEETKKQKSVAMELVDIVGITDLLIKEKMIKEIIHRDGMMLNQAVSFTILTNEAISKNAENPSVETNNERFLVELPIQSELTKMMEKCLNQTWRRVVTTFNSIEFSKSFVLTEITHAVLLSGLIVAGNEQAMNDYLETMAYFLIRYMENVAPEKMKIH